MTAQSGSMTLFDKKTITEKISRGDPATVSFKYAGKDLLMMINGMYTMLLTAHDQLYILNSVISIMREVVTNAQKANAKRVYFITCGLDIKNPDDYKKGMERFKADFMQKPENLRELLVKSDFNIEIHVRLTEDELSIKVSNNAAVHPREMERIYTRLERARSYTSLMDAYEDLQDSSEGAGLGIALVVVTLKNIGIDPSLFTIESQGDTTEVTLRIPLHLKPHEIISRIKERILQEIHDLPPLPSSINRVIDLCNDPDSTFGDIAGTIMSDPALASNVLKLSNSAAFISGKRIENISEAVRILGLRNIRSLIMAGSARQIIEQRYGQFEKIWEHSNQVACYARCIGQDFWGSGVAEKALLAGLLHDLGKIILLATDEGTVKKISEQLEDRPLDTETFMEEISIGISHSTMGGLIAEGWNFPDYLVEAIRHHHSPLDALAANEPVVHAVYLANMLCGIEEKKYEYHYLYENILEKYRLSDEKSFNSLHAVLKNAYKAEYDLKSETKRQV